MLKKSGGYKRCSLKLHILLNTCLFSRAPIDQYRCQGVNNLFGLNLEEIFVLLFFEVHQLIRFFFYNPLFSKKKKVRKRIIWSRRLLASFFYERKIKCKNLNKEHRKDIVSVQRVKFLRENFR